MFFTNYDLYDLYAVFVLIRAYPDDKANALAVDAVKEVVDAPQGQFGRTNAIRSRLGNIPELDREKWFFIDTQNVYTYMPPILKEERSIMNKKLKDLIEKVAKENNIPIQYTNSGSRTWTNADQIHFIGEGIPTMLLNIPLRYMHSSAEVANMDDVNNLSKLMYLIIKEITEDFSFNPYE